MNPTLRRSALLIRLHVIVVLAGLLTVTGTQIAPRAGLGTAGGLLASAFTAASFTGALTFRRNPPWDQVFFLTSAFLLGFLLPSIFGWRDPGRYLWRPAILAIGGLATSAGAGRGMRAGFRTLAPALWVLSLVYWIGWFVLGLTAAGTIVQVAWSAGGYVVFWGLAASWAAGLSWVELDRNPMQKGLELYLLVLNLLLSAHTMLRPI